jgi:hypothetical protein
MGWGLVAVDLRELVESEKSIAVFTSWERRAGYYRFFAPLDIEGVTIEGLELRGSTLVRFPDQSVTFQLQYQRTGARMMPLCRIEWRPIKPHDNKGVGPPEYRFLKLTGSHIHPFDLNLKMGTTPRTKDNLPVAIPLEPDPTDFHHLLEIAGQKLRITNLGSVPVPEWEAELI